jgi:hypothetical protein
MVSEPRKHMENFEKFHFHPQNLKNLKTSGNIQHQNPEQSSAPNGVYPDQTSAPNGVNPEQTSAPKCDLFR